jgi:hypothetical protein
MGLSGIRDFTYQWRGECDRRCGVSIPAPKNLGGETIISPPNPCKP